MPSLREPLCVIEQPPAPKGQVNLRNAHPKQTVYLPIRRGWHRVLRPAVTTCVPERVLHTPAVRQLLIRKLVEVVDGSTWDADARQLNASRTDMLRAIAQAEQREFDQLLKGVTIAERWAVSTRPRKRRADEWPDADLALLRQRRSAGVPYVAIAAELGRPEGAVARMARRRGFTPRSRALAFWKTPAAATRERVRQ